MEPLADTIERLRTDRRIADYDESTTKQTIILQLLSLLGWNIFSADEVAPEYSVETRRVDYSLRLKNRNAVFLEVKKPREDLENHQNQLLDYAFKQGVELAVLTNGMTWWLYLPLKPGSWSQRKFLTIDFGEQGAKTAAERLVEFLSKASVESGAAVASADKIHSGRRRVQIIQETLPEAWNKLISEPDSLLIDLLIESTEKICGYRPDQNSAGNFLRVRQDHLILDTVDDELARQVINGRKHPPSAPRRSEIVAASDSKSKGSSRASGTIRVFFDKGTVEAPSIPQLYMAVLRRLVDDGRINNLTIPWGIGSRRYFVAKGPEPIHPSGRKFFAPVEYKGYVLESHVNRASGVKYLGEFCETVGVEFQLIDM